MVQFFLEGFLVSIAYVAPMGIPNSYVIHAAGNSGKLKPYQFALISSIFGFFLAVTCFLGIGSILSGFPEFKKIILPIGCIAIIYRGMDLLLPISEDVFTEIMDQSHGVSAVKGFDLNWLNPRTIVNGILLFGVVRASFSAVCAKFFIIGAAVASIAWFFSQVTFDFFFQNKIQVKFFNILNRISGSIILGYGLTLAFRLIKTE